MLEYGINFNTADGAAKAQKELEELNKRWQKLFKDNPLEVNFSKIDLNKLASSGSMNKMAKDAQSVGEQLRRMRAEFRGLTVDEAKAGEGNRIIEKYRQLRTEAGIYAGTLDQAVKAQDKLAAQSDKATGAIQRQNTEFKRQSEMLVQLKSYAMNFLSVYGGIRLTKNLIDITGEFEMQRVSLQAILQDAEKGAAIFERIKGLAVISPFQFKDLVAYTKQLSAFSVPYEELYDTTKMLADVSAGLGVEMYRIILAYGQVRSAAVLRGQELRQFTEAGIPLVQMLADKFTALKGEVVSAADVFDLISTRQVPFEMIKDIFVEMTSEGGKFYKMQEKQAETLKGKVANLKDAYQIMFSEIGGKGEKVLKGAVDGTRFLMENYDTIGRILLTMVATYGAYRTAILVAATAEMFLSGTYVAKVRMMRLVIATQRLLNATMLANPYVIATAAIVGLATGLYLYATRASAAERATKSLNDQIEKQKQDVEDERSKLQSLLNTIKDETSTRNEKEQALKTLQRMMPSIFKNMDVEAVKTLNLTDVTRQYNEQLEKRNHLQNRANLDSAKELLNAKEGDWRWTIEERQKALSFMGKNSSRWNVLNTPASDIVKEFKEWVSLRDKALSEYEKDFVKQKLGGDKGVKDTYSDLKILKKELSDAQKKYKEMQEQASKGIISTEVVSEQKDRIDKLKSEMALMGWEEPKQSDINKAEKEREKRIKEFLDGVQSQVDEYKKKFNIYNELYDSTGERPVMNFDVVFDGEPDIAKYIKAKMRQIGGDGLKLDVDFLTADFGDILNGATFDEQTMDKLKSLFDELRNISNTEFQDIQKLYETYATYVQKKAKLDREYITERRKLVESGADAKMLSEQALAYEEETDRLINDFAKKDKAFNDFVTSLTNQSVDRLRFLLMQLQSSLTQETARGASAETIALLKAKISVLEEELRNAQKKINTADDVEDSYKKWKQLQSVLGKVNKSFDEIGDSVGGLSGEIIALAGDITVSTLEMINGIVMLADWSIKATEMTAKGVAKSIQAVEKASVILAVVAAAMQIASKIWNLLSRTREVSEKTIKQYEALVKVTNDVIASQKELIATLSGAEAQREQEKTLDLIKKQLDATVNLGKEYMRSGGGLFKKDYGKRMQKDLRGYSDELARLGINYNALGGKLEGLFDLSPQTLALIKKEIPEFWAKLTDDARGYLETIIELGDKNKEIAETTKQAFTGTEFDEILGGLDDFITSADSDFAMLAENFEQYMSNAMLNIIRTQYLTDALKGWYDDFAEMMTDGSLTESERIYLENLYKNIAEEGKRRYDLAKDMAGIETQQTNLQGISKAIGSMSEDTALILGGYLDSIRIKFFPLADYFMGDFKTTMSQFTVYQSQMVGNLVAIEANTRKTAESNGMMLENISKVISPDGTRGAFAINVNT